MARKRRVFVLGGYQPFAAGYLVYHVGRILSEHFGYEPVVIRLADETPDRSPFAYEKPYQMVEGNVVQGMMAPDDLFLPLATAWNLNIGLSLNCRKILYVQGANTFKVLDGFMDRYVSVSRFVQETIQTFYEIPSEVIHPFVDAERLTAQIPWKERQPGSVVMLVKPAQIADTLVRAFKNQIAHIYPDVNPVIQVVHRGLAHRELMSLLGQTRYFVSLSPTEGFGLAPLEAMAAGCAVVGFHGGGGRDYMTERNSRNVGYPQLARLVDLFAEVYRDEALAMAIAEQGRTDAKGFTRERFDADWVRYLRTFGA